MLGIWGKYIKVFLGNYNSWVYGPPPSWKSMFGLEDGKQMSVPNFQGDKGTIVVAKLLSYVWQFETPWTVARQVPLFVGLPRQEYWSGLPFPSPEDLPNPGIKPVFLPWQSGFFTHRPTGETPNKGSNWWKTFWLQVLRKIWGQNWGYIIFPKHKGEAKRKQHC